MASSVSSRTITVSRDTTSYENDEVTRTCWGRKRPVILQRRVQLKQQPAHLYVSRDVGLMGQFSNVREFCLKYNEEHLLMLNNIPCFYPAVVKENDDDDDDYDVPIKVDTDQVPVHIAYLVRVIDKRTVVNVGPDTSLSMLLNMACIHVDHLLLNESQMCYLMKLNQHFNFSGSSCISNSSNSSK
jgi:hypothetical protein